MNYYLPSSKVFHIEPKGRKASDSLFVVAKCGIIFWRQDLKQTKSKPRGKRICRRCFG